MNLELLTNLIYDEIQSDFKDKHLTKNLMQTMFIEERDGKFEIHIPAEIYNMYKYFKEGVIEYTGEGSYASQLDDEGSAFMLYYKGKKGGWHRKFKEPRNHIGFVENAIQRAVKKYSEVNGWQTRVEKH